MLELSAKFIDTRLPNKQRRQALCKLISYAFTDIRSYAWEGKYNQAAELADIFHNIPQEMYGYGLWDLSVLVEDLAEFEKDVRELSHDKIEIIICETNDNTILSVTRDYEKP